MKNMTLRDAVNIIIENKIIKLDNGCWKPTSNSFRVNGKSISVVRMMLEVFKPLELPIYKRPKIGRSCGNSFCVNPEHIFYKSTWHRFWEKVIKKSDEDCWEWVGAVDGGNYGSFLVNNRPHVQEKSHRYSWMMEYGDIPNGMFVCHACDNPKCVNPKHLFLGTNADNVKDKMIKGREVKLKGRLNGMCKLSEDDVKEIVNLHNKGVSYRNLSKKFGIGYTQIGRIIHKESWKWLWD